MINVSYPTQKKYELLTIENSLTNYLKIMLLASLNFFKKNYIKKDKIKHISLKFFNIFELQQKGKVDIKQVR
jgi:hypothetical protein